MVSDTSPSAPGTSAHIMNMSRPRSTASTISTILNPIKRKLGLKKSSRGTNALFRAISAENWQLVVSICESKPYKAESWHNALGFFDAHRSSKILPLHQACIFHPTRDAIRHIIQAHPYALRSKETGYARVPLHIACHSNASLDVIRELLSSYPAASIIPDVIGRVPLHYALSNGASITVVEELLNAAGHACGSRSNGRKEICSFADFNGWLPIHVACFMGASPEVLTLLVKSFPEGVDRSTKKNSTPLSLLRGISLSPQKKDEMEAILLRDNTPQVKYAARVSPARTDIDKVVRMSDETCSKGVTLEIDEGETSSLSSMEDTVRTGARKRTASHSSRKHLQYGGDRRRVEAPVGTSLSHFRAIHVPALLPTHSAYDDEEDEGIINRRAKPHSPTSTSTRVHSPTASKSNKSSAQASSHDTEHTYYQPQYAQQQLQLQHASQDQVHSTQNRPFPRKPLNTLLPASSNSDVRTRTMTAASTTSSSTDVVSHGTEKVVFQQITSTAFFC